MDRLINRRRERADRREKPVGDASASDRRGCLRLATSLHRLSETFEGVSEHLHSRGVDTCEAKRSKAEGIWTKTMKYVSV